MDFVLAFYAIGAGRYMFPGALAALAPEPRGASPAVAALGAAMASGIANPATRPAVLAANAGGSACEAAARTLRASRRGDHGFLGTSLRAARGELV